MKGFFGKKQASAPLSERALLEQKYSSSRYNLLLVVIFTLINVIIALTGGDTYFLFSASIPYYIALFVAIWCGKMPAYYYEGSGITEADFLPDSVLIVGAIIAIVILAIYLLFWIMSKKKVGWLIASIVFFALDAIFMFAIFGISADMIIDAVFHVWVVISLAIAVFIGIMGRALFPTAHLTASSAENIFITLATSSLPAILAGFVMAGILAATISSSDSYLLIAASAVAKNIFQGVVKKKATDKQVMLVTRITLLAIALVAIVIALDENSIIFKVVSFAWAGFGATFGPLMIFSLFWKRINRAGAIAGMVSGASMVFIWKLLISKLGGVFAIYELLPAFIISSVFIVVVSLLTKAPSKEIEEDFDAVKEGRVNDADYVTEG